MIKVLFLSAIFLIIQISLGAEKNIVCYHGTWSTYRSSIGKFDVSNINPFLCTHLVYAFFGIEENGEFRVIDPFLDLQENWGRGNIKKFNDLKKINTNLKTLAAVGGWNEGSYKFSQVAKDPIKRQRFVNSSVQFILKHGFDGLDLDWEYPGQRDGDINIDKTNYIFLLKELKQELSKHNLLLTAAVASVEYSANKSYNIAEVSKYLDLINVMAYDLHGSWDSIIGINAPLYGGSSDVNADDKQLNVNASITYWLNEGAQPEKLVLGLPAYGRSFTLRDTSQTHVGALSNGPGLPGRYTNEPGMIGYIELCEKFATESWTRKWETTQQVPYAYKGNQWIGYDDEKSVELKTKYVVNKNLGGIMIWSVETDDFRGICGEDYPLLKKINRVLGRNIPKPPSTTPSPSTNTPQTQTPPNTGTTSSSPEQTQTPPNIAPQKCSIDGIFRHENDCAKFYICSSSIRYDFRCPGNLLFDENINSCNYSDLVEC